MKKLNEMLIVAGYKNHRGQIQWDEIRYDAVFISLLGCVFYGVYRVVEVFG